MSVSRYRKLNLIHAPNYCVDRLMYMSMNIIKKLKKKLLTYSIINVMLIMKLNKRDIAIIQVCNCEVGYN